MNEPIAPQPPESTALGRVDVLNAIHGLLPSFERLRDHVRMVGTASSLLRGIDLPVGDVDVLAKERVIVDELAAHATAAGGSCLAPPAWEENPGFGQYIAKFELSGVRVEFSTVETHLGDAGIGECINNAPWEHFDTLEVEGHRVPVVASELRLLSEVARLRPERWRPIGAHLSRHGYNEVVFDAACKSLSPDLQGIMRDAVGKTNT